MRVILGSYQLFLNPLGFASYSFTPQEAAEPSAWLSSDGARAMSAVERDGWIVQGYDTYVFDYITPLFTHPPKKGFL